MLLTGEEIAIIVMLAKNLNEKFFPADDEREICCSLSDKGLGYFYFDSHLALGSCFCLNENGLAAYESLTKKTGV